MAVLPTNYLDDILAASMGGKRRFRITHEDGSTEEVTLEDVSEYEQVGSPFGSGDVNKTNQAVNEKLDSADVVDPALATVLGFAADAKLTGDALSELNKNLSKKGKYTYLGYTASENTAVTLSEPITNFEEIVVYSRYQGYTLGMLRRPADHFNDGKESIISFNDGTIRKAQFTLVKNTVVAKYLTEVSDITIYGISRINY